MKYVAGFFLQKVRNDLKQKIIGEISVFYKPEMARRVAPCKSGARAHKG